MKSDKLILKKWFTRNGLSKGTRHNYEIIINEYCKFIGKNLSQLIEEAETQEEKGIKPMKRSVNDYIFLFKDHLDESYAPGTVNNKIAAIKSFYKAYDIQFIDIKVHKGDTVLDKNMAILLKKEDIQKMLDVSNTRDRAIIYLMSLTGLASNEVRNLTIQKFIKYASLAINKPIESIEDLFNQEDNILKKLIVMEITREKVKYRHHVIIPPEATRPIIAYLKERYYNRNKNRRIDNLDSPIFVTYKGTPMSKTGIGSEIKRIGKLAGFKSEEKGAYSYWRPHGFRKYFISTIIRNTGDQLLADYLVGHTIDQTTRAYWIVQPDELKEKYLSIYEHLSIDSVKVNVLNVDNHEIEQKLAARDTLINQMEEKMGIIESLLSDSEFLKDYKNLSSNL